MKRTTLWIAAAFLASSAVWAAEEEVETNVITWGEAAGYGGWPLIVLLGLSVLFIAFVIYFATVLRASQVAPKALLRDIVEKIGAGQYDEARRLCEYKRTPISSIALAALNFMRDVPEAEYDLIKDVIEGEGARQAETIQGQTHYLLDLGTVAPMVGLLGTVIGILKSFGSIAREVAEAKPEALAQGLSQALITTIVGLVIGIPAMIAYSFYRRRAANMVAVLEVASVNILAAVANRD